MTVKDDFAQHLNEELGNQDTMELWHIFTRVARNSKKRMERELDQLGIKPIELRILFTLSKEGPSTMNTLSSENDVTGPWITGMVDEMEKKGFVTKIRSVTDRRSINVSITDAGEDMLARGVKIYTDLISSSLSNLKSDEISQFKEILIKIENALSGQNSAIK